MNETLVCEGCGEPLGITIEQYEKKLKEQDGKCALCDEEIINFAVFHDQEGVFRGLVCIRCIVALEALMKEYGEDNAVIIKFIEEHFAI
jgi:hypothetical protein